MVQRIDSRELTTRLAAKKRYRNYYIGFVTSEQNMSDPDNEEGYVAYVADSEDEQYQIPRDTEDGQYISIMTGHSVGGTRIGVAVFDD